jgi:hypothetical protein
VSTSDCISSVQPQTFFFVILFDKKSLAVVLEHRSLLIVFLSIGRLLQSVLEQRKSLDVCLSNCNQILHFSELSLEVQGGLDYFRIEEGTSIIGLCLSSSLSVFIRFI